MAIRTYKVTLDTKNTIAPEPVLLRQGDKTGAVVIDATLMDNGEPVSLDGLTPMFKANTADGKALIADSTGFNIVNASGGEFTYQVPSALSSVPGKIMTAYFSFSDKSGTQSTFDVAFIIKKAVGITQNQAEDYIATIGAIGVKGAYNNLQALISAKPDGDIGIYVTTDTGHWFFWNGTTWQDGGQFQAAGIDQTVVDQTKKMFDKLYKLPELIDGQPNPNNKDTVFSTINYLGQEWIKMTSTANTKYRGIQLLIDDPDRISAMANYPIKIYFNIQSSIDQSLGLDVHFYDGNGNDMNNFVTIDGISLQASKILNYEKEFSLDASHLKGATKVGILLTTSGTSDIGTVLFNNYSAVLEYNKIPSKTPAVNQLPELIESQPFPTNVDTVISTTEYLDQEWIKMTSTANTKYRGLQFLINNPDKIPAMANYPIKIYFNIQSSIDQSLGLDVHFYDGNGNDMNNFVTIDGISLTASKILSYEKEISLDSGHLVGAKTVGIWLTTSGTNDLGTVLINNYSAVIDYNKNENPINTSSDYKQLPEVYLNGSTTGMSGTNYVTMQFKFKDNGREVDGFASTKWQGDSSLAHNKKAYRIKTFEDQGLTQAMKFKPCPLWSADNKYNLKAYYTDALLCRDVVNANIGTDLWSTQKNMPDDLVKTDDFGFIDGFPVKVFINNEFAGIYSFNTAKGDYGKNTKAVISGEQYTDTTAFSALPTGGVKLDGSDFEMVSPDNPTDEIKTAVNNLITFVSTSSDTDFKAQLGTHIDLESLIDYFIFLNVIENSDAAGKNQTLITWDLQKWYFHPYDLDTTYGAEFDGTIHDPATGLYGLNSHLFTRLNTLFANEIKSRYKELRTWLTPAYVLKKYRDRINLIGESNYEDEFKLWNNPNNDKNTYNFLKFHIYNQFKLLDSFWLQ